MNMCRMLKGNKNLKDLFKTAFCLFFGKKRWIYFIKIIKNKVTKKWQKNSLKLNQKNFSI